MEEHSQDSFPLQIGFPVNARGEVDPLKRPFGLYFVLRLTTSKEILLVSMAGFITGGFRRADLKKKKKKQKKGIGFQPTEFVLLQYMFFKKNCSFSKIHDEGWQLAQHPVNLLPVKNIRQS